MQLRRVARPVLLTLFLGALAQPSETAPGTTAQAGQPAAQKPAQPQTPAAPLRTPDVIYVPTPHEVVAAMLKLAKVGPNDVVYDLGSGDGRIPIAAVEKFNAKSAVGIDINPERIKEAHENLARSQAGNRVKFILGDLFEQNISEATVVTLYLLPSLNVKLIPKFKAELKPGTRIVSQSFDMQGQWEPEETITVEGRQVYLWTIK